MTPEQNWWNIHRSEGILNIKRMAGVYFLLPVSLRHNWHTPLCTFKVYRITTWLASWQDYCDQFSERLSSHMGLPWGLSGKEPARQCRRLGFDPWSRMLTHATEQLNPCVTIIEPVLYSPGAMTTETTCHIYCSLRALEPVLQNKRSHCMRSPCPATREQPLLASPIESHCSNKDLDSPK